MHNLNELELLRKAIELNRTVRKVLITAYAVREDLEFQHLLQKPLVDLLIEKPVTIAHLYQRVRNELQVHELNQK